LCYTRSDSVGIPTGYTGIEDLDPFENMMIYPNPTSGIITVDIFNQLFGDLYVSVITQTGKEILSKKYEKTTENFLVPIDISSQAEGVYFIRLLIDKYSAVRKVILE
jgi:hypothetical protein